MYTAKDKMCDLMGSGAENILIVSRFGIPFGVGEQTIEEVCRAKGVHTDTFLSLINHKPSDNIDVETLMIYLRNSHAYFLQQQFPRIRQELIEAISQVQTHSRIPWLLIKLWDEYVEEVKVHIQHENNREFQLHEDDDEHVAAKISEVKNLLLKYYPTDAHNERLYSVMQDILQVEKDLAQHCTIEDDIVLPCLTRHQYTESLSSRERDVLIEVVKGLSNKEIADALNISTHTVITHRKNIARKLNIHSVAGLTIYAIVNQLVCLDELKNI